jgi:hypothetical protein
MSHFEQCFFDFIGISTFHGPHNIALIPLIIRSLSEQFEPSLLLLLLAFAELLRFLLAGGAGDGACCFLRWNFFDFDIGMAIVVLGNGSSIE